MLRCTSRTSGICIADAVSEGSMSTFHNWVQWGLSKWNSEQRYAYSELDVGIANLGVEALIEVWFKDHLDPQIIYSRFVLPTNIV